MITIKKYNNGLTLIHNKLPIKSTRFTILVNSGAMNDGDARGVAHYVEHTMFKGTNNFNEKELSEEFSNNGIFVNASTNLFNTKFYIVTTDKNCEKGIELLSDMILNSKFDKDAHDLEKNVILQEYYSKVNNFSQKVYMNLYNNFFKDACFGVNTIGTEECIKNMTIEQVKNYYNKFYTADNMILSYSGGLPIEQIEYYLAKHFLPSLNNLHAVNNSLSYSFNNQKYFYEKNNNNQCYINIGYWLPLKSMREYRMLTLFNLIFASGSSSRLFNNIRTNLGLCYGVDGSFLRIKNFNNSYIIDLQTNANNSLKVVQAIDEEISKISKEGITKLEYDRVNNIMDRYYVLDEENFSSKSNDNAEQFGAFNRIISNDEEIELLKSITYEELNDFCKNILQNRERFLSVISCEENLELKKYWLDSLVKKNTIDNENILIK